MRGGGVLAAAEFFAGRLPEVGVVDPALPEGIGHLELLDVPGRWGRVDAFGRGRVRVNGGSRARRAGRPTGPRTSGD
jgi:hypothetical protein